MQIFNFEAEYGLAARVSLLLNLNYLVRNRELTARNALGNVTQRLKVEGDGLGDPVVMVKYLAIAPTLTGPFELALGAGAKPPIGNYRQQRNKRILQATGSSAWYVEPALSYLGKNSIFRIFGQIPVYQNVRSIQLTPSWMVGMGLGFVFDFSNNGNIPNSFFLN